MTDLDVVASDDETAHTATVERYSGRWWIWKVWSLDRMRLFGMAPDPWTARADAVEALGAVSLNVRGRL